MNGEFFELQIAREILATVRRCELPLQLDSLTEADGNCFPRFVDNYINIINNLGRQAGAIKQTSQH